ncbi:MAG: hypothetical protein Q7J73_06175, partial [Dehalococcoidales bacterium]|nr:hypothetical protein [Dehalococcoidales bacterium]
MYVPAPGTDTGINVTLELSRPANGSYVAAGERMVVTVTLKDKYGSPLAKNDFSTLALYMYGPQEVTRTVTAVKMLNASTNRSATPHHYIDLLTNNTTDIKVTGSVVQYTLQPVTDEEAGTYTASLRATRVGDPPVNQVFLLADFQLKTATVEAKVIDESKCAACHQGASNGQFYFHHVDVSARNPYGTPSIDTAPVRTCKSCHNNDGYSSYTYTTNITSLNGTSLNGTRVLDVIVNRVHGVHMGEELENPLNTDPVTGAFRNFREVVFPNNVKNCTTCHINDNWKTKPSRLACGACHDNIWFGIAANMPRTAEPHPGGPWPDDKNCAVCHKPDVDFVVTPSATVPPTALTNVTVPSITNAHKVQQPLNTVNISMTRPANGQFYVAGEKPVVTLVYRDDNGNPIDHTAIDTNYLTANLYVYGPRWQSKPVLTNTAINGNTKVQAAVTSTIAGPWTFAAGDNFKIAVSGGAVQTIAAPVGVQTAAQVAAWLQANLTGVTVTNPAATSVRLTNNLFGDASKFAIYNSPVTTKMGWKPAGLPIIKDGVTVRYAEGTTMEPYVIQAAVGTPAVNLRLQAAPNYNDPNVVRTQGSITYQLLDTAGLTPGTYMVYSYNVPVGVTAGNGTGPRVTDAAKAAARSREGLGLITFQVGTATVDKKVATNCTNCHGSNIWHLDTGAIHSAPFDTDYCKACHDYGLSGVGEGYSRTGGTSTSGWAGYGTKPLVNRLHGVHFGSYKNRPEDIYAGNANEFAGVIFPQDVRNCVKCHPDGDTNGTWKTEPSVLACMACHDS